MVSDLMGRESLLKKKQKNDPASKKLEKKLKAHHLASEKH